MQSFLMIRGGGYFQNNWVGVCGTLPETFTLFQTKICDFPLPYFRPVPSCYGTYTIGLNIKRKMVLSPYDEEVASSKKHTWFKTRVHKPYPISEQNG